ncbi:glutamate racemase [Lacisediminimonas profundi]|uniref:glutamate racemase n=1 Tax=Lacisediminimonas profundi TaxID=2603856 RepID=UPI00124B6A8F|nr:glutamate racemase [Lacisediminimonas profundi]
MTETTPTGANAPVGVFDSGVGGLSVLRPIRALLPHEDLLYFADSAHAPYGGKSEAEVAARAQAIAAFLLEQGVKAMVVACNTATAVAIDAIRKRYPSLPVVGVEPGLKPGAAATRCGKVGVLATEGTLASQRFQALRDQIAAATGAQFLAMPCPGLADQIEKGELRSAATAALVARFVTPLIRDGADTLVLGCTHYPFILPLIEESALAAADGKDITVIDTGTAVARQLQRLLEQRALLNAQTAPSALAAFTTGNSASLSRACERLLQLSPPVMKVDAQENCQPEAKFV